MPARLCDFLPAVQFPAIIYTCLSIWKSACLYGRLPVCAYTCLPCWKHCLPTFTSTCLAAHLPARPCTCVPGSALYICLPDLAMKFTTLLCMPALHKTRLPSCTPVFLAVHLPNCLCLAVQQPVRLHSWLLDCAISSWLCNCHPGF